MTRQELLDGASAAPRVSIILVNWNSLEHTQACLLSLEHLDYPNFEVIVVDNNSAGNDGALLQEQWGYFARIICRGDNGGFVKANNEAMELVLKEGISEFILLLNNDTIAEPSFLSPLVGALENDAIAIASPIIYYHTKEGPSELIWYAGGKVNFWLGKPKHIIEAPPGPCHTLWASGCAMLIRASALWLTGLLDEAYFAYGEDVDLCLRLRRLGLGCVVLPASRIWHKVLGSMGDIRAPLRVYLGSRNSILFMRRHARWWHYLTFGPQFALYHGLRLSFFGMTARFKAARALLAGIADGMRGRFGRPPPWLLKEQEKFLNSQHTSVSKSAP